MQSVSILAALLFSAVNGYSPMNEDFPASLPGLVAWWDPTQGTFQNDAGTTVANTAGQQVRSWMSRYGTYLAVQHTTGQPNLATATATAAASPIAERAVTGGSTRVIETTNANQSFRVAYTTSTTNFSVHAFVKHVPRQLGWAFGLTTASFGTFFTPMWTADGIEAQVAGTNCVGPQCSEDGQWRLYSWVRSGSTLTVYIDGVEAKTYTAANTITPTGFKLIGEGGGSGGSVGQQTGDVMFASAAHSAAEVEQIYQWAREHRLGYGLRSLDVLWIGDSISTNAYTTQAFGTIARQFARTTGATRFANISSGGTTALNWQSWTPSRIGRVDAQTTVCVWLGTNDIELATVTGQAVYDRIAAIVAAVNVKTAKVIVGTAIPRSTFTIGNGRQAVRDAFNSLLLATKPPGSLGVANLLLSDAFDADADTSQTTWYNADGVHLNVTGIGEATPFFVQAAQTSTPPRPRRSNVLSTY